MDRDSDGVVALQRGIELPTLSRHRAGGALVRVIAVAPVRLVGGRLEWRLVGPAMLGSIADGKQLAEHLRAAAAEGGEVFGAPRRFPRAPLES